MTLERILVAYDGSEPAFRALEQAAEVGQVEDAQVDLVIVGTPELHDPEVIIQQAVGYLCDRGFDPEVAHPLRRSGRLDPPRGGRGGLRRRLHGHARPCGAPEPPEPERLGRRRRTGPRHDGRRPLRAAAGPRYPRRLRRHPGG